MLIISNEPNDFDAYHEEENATIADPPVSGSEKGGSHFAEQGPAPEIVGHTQTEGDRRHQRADSKSFKKATFAVR